MAKTSSQLPADPLGSGGLAEFAAKLRSGATTSETVTRAYLDRIAALDGRLGAFEYVARDQALAQARAIDSLLASGTDLGPLMGVPVAVKDLLAVDGMPTTSGSNLDVNDVVGSEGPFMKRLKALGCVILGKVKTVEFAMGSTGISRARGTPWNPCDPNVHRFPGGSSSGSAVAVAAQLCAFAIGSDTGGSVRNPAAFCGVFGLKTTKGLWSTDGVFPLSTTFDTLGPLTRSAADAAIVYAVIEGRPVPTATPARGLRLGRPTLFYEDLDQPVRDCLDLATKRLAQAGVEIVDVDIASWVDGEPSLADITRAELIAGLGRDRFAKGRNRIDPEIARKGAIGLDVMADTYLKAVWRSRRASAKAREKMAEFDGWITPIAPMMPLSVTDHDDSKALAEAEMRIPNVTRYANWLGLCGTATPIQALGAPLPVGLQIMGAGGSEAHTLGIARLIEDLIGKPRLPDASPFAA